MNNTFLLNEFYTIKSTERAETMSVTTIQLNCKHEIFKGHFKEMPIVPGVCQTQIIKELLQLEVNDSLILTKGDNIKFTGMIIPSEHPIINIEISYKKEENNYNVDAKLFFENIIFTKFKATFAKN